MDNIEALAGGEDVHATVDCNGSGSGSIYCPVTNSSTYKEIIIRQQ